jgi:AcrR family transcriptional regulator
MSTHKRVLAAAFKVFSEHGLTATTKEIAREARVNEVTLFRQFESKQNLVAAVTLEMLRHQAESLARIDLENPDLRRDVTRIAKAYDRSVSRYMGFIRALISQPGKPDLRDRITSEAIDCFRTRFKAYLERAQSLGLVRKGRVRKMDFSVAIDAFIGMIFLGALRRDLRRQPYSRAKYLEMCVEIFLSALLPGTCENASDHLHGRARDKT